MAQEGIEFIPTPDFERQLRDAELVVSWTTGTSLKVRRWPTDRQELPEVLARLRDLAKTMRANGHAAPASVLVLDQRTGKVQRESLLPVWARVRLPGRRR